MTDRKVGNSQLASVRKLGKNPGGAVSNFMKWLWKLLGASDGARTRDLRRDRPYGSSRISTRFPEFNAPNRGVSGRKLGSSKGPFNIAGQDDLRWHQRAELAIELLSGVGPIRSLADIGCGDQKFGRLLKARFPDATYAGFDLVPQSPEVTRFDLAGDVLPGTYDAAVILGVLEYLADPPDLPALAARVRHLVVSYGVRDLQPDNRLAKFTTGEFEALLVAAGFSIEATAVTPNGRQRIWVCSS